MDEKLSKKKGRVKYCGHCLTEKPFDEYHNCKTTKDGKYSYCRKCHNKKRMESYYRCKHKIKDRTKEENEKRRLYAISYRKKWKERDLEGFRKYHREASKRTYEKKKEREFEKIYSS